jgi:hypothetical protein
MFARRRSTDRIPASRGIVSLADIPEGECRHGPPELVIRCKHSMIPVPVLARRRDEIGEPVEELKRREVDDAIGPRSRGLAAATGSDPVGRLMSRQHVADASDLAICTASYGEPLEREGWPGTIPKQVLQAPKIAWHVAVDEAYGSSHPDACGLAMADGSVRSVEYSIDPIVHLSLSSRAGGP